MRWFWTATSRPGATGTSGSWRRSSAPRFVSMLVSGAFLESLDSICSARVRRIRARMSSGACAFTGCCSNRRSSSGARWRSVSGRPSNPVFPCQAPRTGGRTEIIADARRRIANDLGQYSSIGRKSRTALLGPDRKASAANYEISKEIAAGDFLLCYAGTRTADGMPAAVKAVVAPPCRPGRSRLKTQLQKARLLADPVFVRFSHRPANRTSRAC